MASALNGICLHDGLRPYGGTFLVFSDYMRPAVRMAAITKLPSPTCRPTTRSVSARTGHPQPVEQLAALRAMPGLDVVRPADATETAIASWNGSTARLGCA